MLITFSMQGAIKFADIVLEASTIAPALDIKWTRGREVRFTLPGASSDQHDQVIRALLTLDPQAKVRTARAVYEGLADYEAQLKVRA